MGRSWWRCWWNLWKFIAPNTRVINIISIERLPIETTSATLCGIFSKENVENLLRKSLPRENFIPQTTSEGDNPALRWTNIWQKLLSTVNKYFNKYLTKITYSIKQWFVKDKSIFVRWIFSQMFFFMEDGKYFSVLFHFCTLCNIFMAP